MAERETTAGESPATANDGGDGEKQWVRYGANKIEIRDKDIVKDILSRSPSPPDTIYTLVSIEEGKAYAIRVQTNVVRGGMTTTPPPFYVEISTDSFDEIKNADSIEQLNMLREKGVF